MPRRSPIPASRPALSCAAETRPSEADAMIRLASPESSSSKADIAGIPARRATHAATKSISPSIAAATISSSVKPPSSSSKATRVAVRIRCFARRHGPPSPRDRFSKHRSASSGPAPTTSSCAAPQRASRPSARGSSAEDRRNAIRHWPKRSRRRPRARIRAMAAAATAPSLVADEALQDPRLAAAAARTGPRGNPLLVGAPKQKRASGRLGRASRRRQALDQREIAFIIGRGVGRSAALREAIGDIADQAVQHRRHQRPLLLGQALRRIEEEVDTDGSQPVAARAGARARSGRLQKQRSAILPASFAGAYRISVNFASTRCRGAHAGQRRRNRA